MLYPHSLEYKLGFFQIKEILKEHCQGSLAKEKVEHLLFSNKPEQLSIWQNQIFEFVAILQNSKRTFPSNNFLDITPFVSKLNIAGAFIYEDEWVHIRKALQTLISCVQYLEHEESASYYHLKELIFDFQLDKTIIKHIDSVIDEDGRVKDNASPELREIRSELITEQSKLRKKLEHFLSNAQKNGFSDEDMSITIRNARLVIPLKAEYKRKYKGFVHDESATGQTVYFEPEEVLELNNYIKELEFAEKREVTRILSALTDQFKKHLPSLLHGNELLGEFDFIKAKALLAIDLKAENPQKSSKCEINWNEARHPLLYLAHSKQNKKTIPLHIELNNEQRILVISGPNAGGKSVCLKTVGLIQYMFQCGLPVSLKDNSTLGVFDDLFVDIGDEQSIENDLSTYSSHLKNLNHFIKFGGKKSLILIDEFGTGTDPQYGGSIAEAILEELHKNKVFAVLNTHYSNLKVLAEQTPGIINGAMRFETDLMEPLYQLDMGKPGSSFALEIAKKIGLDAHVIESAKSKIGEDKVKTEILLVQLEQQKNALEKQKLEFKAKEQALNDALKQYEELKNYVEANKTKVINEAKVTAQNLIKDTNKLIEKTIREIRENKADKDITQLLRNDLEEHKNKDLKIKETAIPKTNPLQKTDNCPIKEGDYVKIKGQDAVGEVVSLRGNDAEVQLGLIKTMVKINKLEKATRKDADKSHKETKITHSRTYDIREKMINFRTDHDFRGMRAEDALVLLERILDDAILLNAKDLRLVHGKGDGVLRQVIRARLKQVKFVQSITDEHADHGGDGVTIVKMK
ncbi:MAG: Smr/MutS family protein [Cytophagales bacterium]